MDGSNITMVAGAPIALGLFALSLAFFFFLGYLSKTEGETSDQFWFDGRGLSLRRQYFTWFAATVAFSSAVLYYMQITATWGWWVYVGSIATYVIGQFIAIAVVRYSHVDLSGFATVGKFVEERSGSNTLGWLVDGMNALALFALVYIEIGIGVKIFSALFTEVNFAFELVAFVSLALVPFLYIRMGGFRAIVESDVWQSVLIFLGLIALAVFLVANHGTQNIFSGEVWFPKPAESIGLSQIFPYLVYGALVNMLISVPQISIWQRLASARSGTRRYRLAAGAVLSAGVIFSVYVAIAGLYALVTGPIRSPVDLLRPIFEAGPFAQEVLFPLVFVGMLAALISSADSSAMSGTQALLGRERIDDQDLWKAKRRKATLFLGIVLLAMFCMHLYIETIGIGFLGMFLTIIFYLFSQLALVAPVVIICAFNPARLRKGPIMLTGLIVAWLMLSVGFLLPNTLVGLIPALTEFFINPYVGGMWTSLVTLTLVAATAIRFEGPDNKERGKNA